jgi:hypothetical protein
MRPHLARAVDELTTPARQAYQALMKLGHATRRDLMTALNWKYAKTYMALAELRRLELVGYEPGRGTKAALFQSLGLPADYPELGLIDPEQLPL